LRKIARNIYGRKQVMATAKISKTSFEDLHLLKLFIELIKLTIALFCETEEK
jgi:hypothetical protein